MVSAIGTSLCVRTEDFVCVDRSLVHVFGPFLPLLDAHALLFSEVAAPKISMLSLPLSLTYKHMLDKGRY